MKTFWIPEIDDFLFEKSVNEGLAPWSIQDYQKCFNTLLDNQYLDPLDYSTFTLLNVKKFMAYHLEKRNWKSATYNQRRKNYKVFCDYLVTHNIIKENPFSSLPNRKAEKHLPRYLDKNKIKELMRVTNSLFSSQDHISLRNKTIVYFYLYTWIRLYELINLDLWDINFLENYFLVRNWKGGKDRIVPLPEELKSYLVEYYFQRVKYNTSDALFITRFWNRLQHREIYNFMNKLKSRLSFPITPHMFRHTFATRCINEWINVYNVSRVLGHSSLKTTEIYLHTCVEDVTTQLNSVRLYW